jgi:hypothetical protein
MIAFIFLCLTNFSSAAPACQGPGSDTLTCLQMKHLKSHLDLFDAQRDLLQTNFSFLEQLSNSMNTIVTNLLVDPNRAIHLSALGEVRNLVVDISALAHNRNLDVLKKTNLVRQKCQHCHLSVPAGNGQTWAEISKQDWGNIFTRCNQFDRNPYVCKNMFAMAGVLNFIQTAEDSSNQSFESILSMITEFQRIISDLKAKNAIHDSIFPLVEAEKRALEVETLVLARDPKVFQKATEVILTCAQCHGSIH